MPVKIVSTTSDPLNGEINQQDVNAIIEAFEPVEVSSTDGRPIVKIDTVSIPALLLQHLLDKIQQNQMNNSKINVKFGVTLPDQKDCTDGVTDVSNHLTVLLVIKTDEQEQLSEGDFVITPGFREYSPNKLADGPCCPVIEP